MAELKNTKGMSVQEFAWRMDQVILENRREEYEREAAKEWRRLVETGQVEESN